MQSTLGPSEENNPSVAVPDSAVDQQLHQALPVLYHVSVCCGHPVGTPDVTGGESND